MRIIMNHIYTKENRLRNGLLEVKSVSRRCRIGFNLKYQKVSCSLLVVVSYFMDRDLGKISFFVLIGPPKLLKIVPRPQFMGMAYLILSLKEYLLFTRENILNFELNSIFFYQGRKNVKNDIIFFFQIPVISFCKQGKLAENRAGKLKMLTTIFPVLSIFSLSQE